MKKIFKRESDNYTLYGALFGLCFPVVATLLRIFQCTDACTLANLIRIQASDPLLWIIDSAPCWLGLFARFGGMRQDSVNFYAQRLEHLVEDRTRELNEANASMAEILHHVPIALFTVNRDRTVNPGCSSFLSALLDGKKCERERFPDMFATGNDVVAAFEEWMAIAFDRKDLTWELLAELTPVTEIEMNAGENRRSLTVAYYPLVSSGHLTKIMVIMREVTAEKKLQESLEAERKRHDEDISQISEILKLDYETFENFIFESRRMVAESLSALDRTHGAFLPREALDDLFRKLHTLKGNARAFKFSQLSAMAHAVENTLDDLRQGRTVLTGEITAAIHEQIHAVDEKLGSIIALSKSLAGGKDLGKARDDGREVFIRVKLEKILELTRLAEKLSSTAFLDTERLNELSAILSRTVAGLRKCPSERLFSRFPKMIKDLGAALNKNARIEMVGGDIEISMDILDAMGNALVHLVRNSMDHGLEAPSKRISCGKPEQGLLRVGVSAENGRLIFTVADDGAGIHREKVLQKAVERGLVSPMEAAVLPDGKIFEFILLPGFTTSDGVTEISGRGVGMDSVNETVRKLGGTITIKSDPGKGTEFKLDIPETV